MTATGCDPKHDAGFQPKYWTFPCVAEAEGAGSRRTLQTPTEHGWPCPALELAAQRRRRADAIAPKQGDRRLVPKPSSVAGSTPTSPACLWLTHILSSRIKGR